MSLWLRIKNTLASRRVDREIDEELESHIEDAVNSGEDPEEARRVLGSALRHCENSRDIRLLPWLDSLRADLIYGWRQLRKHKLTSAAAVVSVGVAIGACTSAFQIVDALLLRPLPIAHPERLHTISFRRVWTRR